MRLRGFLCFLVYVIFGPLIGFACIEVFGFLSATKEFGLQYGLSDRHPKGMMWLFRIKLAYLVGGLPAAATGFYVALALMKNGYSKLRVALFVAILSSMSVGLLGYVIFRHEEGIVGATFGLIVISMLATVVLRWGEKSFQSKDVS